MIGQPIPRLEDARLLRGRGRFVDDVDPPGHVHMHVVRADVAHGRLLRVDTSAAAEAPGVRGVVSAAGLGRPVEIPLRLDFGHALGPYLQPVLAHERVRYVGEPVAVVFADDPYAAEDAADLVAVEIEDRKSVV